eukprot:12177192-Prorocentrum_lima.AAC.1
MTSSLVGSEMCIRDRIRPEGILFRVLPHRAYRSKQRVCKVRPLAVWMWAVSYTHLTLPTICSV